MYRDGLLASVEVPKFVIIKMRAIVENKLNYTAYFTEIETSRFPKGFSSPIQSLWHKYDFFYNTTHTLPPLSVKSQ